MKVVYYPDPVLKQIAKPVEQIDERVEELIDEMFQTMFQYKGCGLAAPQVGISKRILVYTSTGESKDCNVLINPKIIDHEGNLLAREGCLSFPEILGGIKRWAWIKVETLTLENEIKIFEAENFHARVIQHELDHLDGILFTERMEPQDLTEVQSPLKKLQKSYKSQKSAPPRFALIR